MDRKMSKNDLLKELEEVAQRLSYEVSYEALRKTAPYVKSGAVKLEEKKMILIERNLNADKMIEVILEAIRDENLDDIFIKPYVKEIIIKSRGKSDNLI